MSEKESIVRCLDCGGTGKAPTRLIWLGMSSTSYAYEYPTCDKCRGKGVVKQIVKTEVRYEPV